MDGNGYRVLTAADILAANDLEVVEFEMPEWDGLVRVRMLSADEAIRFTDELKTTSAAKKKNAMAELVAKCVVNEDGTQAFTREQIALLGGKSLRALRRLQDFCLEHNGLGDKTREQREREDEALKNA